MTNRLRDLFVSPFVRLDPATGKVLGAELVFDGPELLREAMEAHDAIEAMSRENEATDRGGPWRAALRALTASDRPGEDDDAIALLVAADFLLVDGESPDVMDEHPRCSFVELFTDGDRPADLTDKEIADAALVQPESRNGLRTPDGRELVCRVACYVLGGIDGTPRTPLEKHRDVHRALSGEDYATRYERIKRDGGRITETSATEAQTGPTIRGCKWCASGQ